MMLTRPAIGSGRNAAVVASTASSSSSSVATTIAATLMTNTLIRHQTVAVHQRRLNDEKTVQQPKSNSAFQQAASYGAVPPYRKPPQAPVGTHVPVQFSTSPSSSSSTANSDTAYLRRSSNQESRTPESAVLTAQRGAVFSQEERQNPKLLEKRRLPVGEWLRRHYGDVESGSASDDSALSDSNNKNSKSTTATTTHHGCPLEWYINSLALPVRRTLGPAQQDIITKFEEDTIGEASVQHSREASIEKTRWHGVVRKYTEHASLHLFDTDKFQQHLAELKPQVLGFFGDAAFHSELEEVHEILCDNAVAVRNHTLRELSNFVTANALDEGGLVWSRFFAVVEANREQLLLLGGGGGGGAQNDNDTRLAMWTSSRDAATPVLGPDLCLLFVAVTSMHSMLKPSQQQQLSSSPSPSVNNNSSSSLSNNNIDSNVLEQQLRNPNSEVWVPRVGLVDQYLTRDELFNFCCKYIDRFLQAMDSRVVHQLRVFGFEELARMAEDVVVVSSASSSHQQQQQQIMETPRQKLVNKVVPAFKKSSEVHALMQRLLASTSSSSPSSSPSGGVRQFIIDTLQSFVPEERGSEKKTSSSSALARGHDLHPLFKALEPHWEGIYPRLAATLLSNTQVVDMLAQTLRSLGLHSGSAKTKPAASALESKLTQENVTALRHFDDDARRKAAEVVQIIRLTLLSKSENIAACARMILASSSSKNNRATDAAQQEDTTSSSTSATGAAPAAPVAELIRARAAEAAREAPLPVWLYKTVLEKVCHSYPNWLRVGVVDPQKDLIVSPDPLKAHELLLKIYLRLTYVPHAGNAVLKSRHRRRIGPIARHAGQMNLEAEVGFAEEYNNNEYKQWDWQGWYQRMLDVYHRNVSIRMRLDDARRLDNRGKPFIDLQTERRLRVVASERVGAGMIKLDNDRFEDQADNLDYGTGKLQQVLSEAKKAQLGKEYWPTVEVKVREPSGQSKMRYSLLDWERIEAEAGDNYEKYRVAKSRAIYVPPTETWLVQKRMLKDGGAAADGDVVGAGKVGGNAMDSEGYSVDALFSEMSGGDNKK